MKNTYIVATIIFVLCGLAALGALIALFITPAIPVYAKVIYSLIGLALIALVIYQIHNFWN